MAIKYKKELLLFQFEPFRTMWFVYSMAFAVVGHLNITLLSDAKPLLQLVHFVAALSA